MKLTHVMAATVAILGTFVTTAPAIAQSVRPPAAAAAASSYTPGSVWVASRIKVLPGQFENYMDYLSTTWKRVQELGKREGMVVSYRVMQVNNARQGEPDLILLIEYKDYATTAQQEAMSDKVNAMLAQSDRTADTASAARGPMRELLGSVQYQELILK
jgi:hypothetical protein